MYNYIMREIEYKDLKKEISGKLALVMFSTSWCPDCKMMKFLIEQIEDKHKNVDFIEIDAEKTDLFRTDDSEFKVLKVPSFYLIDDKDSEHLGYEFVPITKIENAIKKRK